MMKMTLVLASLPAWLAAGCGGGHDEPEADGDIDVDADVDGDGDGDADADGDGDGDACESECYLVGDTRCNGDVIESCTRTEDFCRLWEFAEDCAEQDKWCEDPAEGSKCSCDLCPAAGDTRCSGDIVETCVQAEDSCLRWVVEENCAGDGRFCAELPLSAACVLCDGGIWDGNYVITDAASLQDLAGYVAVSGDLQIEATDLVSLEPLPCLQQIGGTLQIESNAALTSLDGLNGLTSVGGSFWRQWSGLRIVDNAALTSLSGLDGLSTVGGQLVVARNEVLSSLDGLGSLDSVDGDIWIGCEPAIDGYLCWGNPVLSNLDGLAGLTSVGSSYAAAVMIGGNESLASLQGLAGLAFASETGSISVTGNDSLTSLQGIAQLVTGEIQHVGIVNNAALTDLNALSGIASTSSVGLEITGNAALTDLNAFSGVTSVGRLIIADDAALADLRGLESLASVNGTLSIGCTYGCGAWGCSRSSCPGNAALASLDGLEALTSVGDELAIGGNTALPTCEADALEAQLRAAGWAGEATIQDNDDAGMCE